MFPFTRSGAAVVASAAIGMSCLAAASPAAASSGWSSLQPSVSFTVYEPYATFGMTRSKLEITDDCASANTVHAVFKAAGSKKIKVYESGSSRCLPPNGGAMVLYVSVKSFPVQDGAGTAEVWMDCETALQCEFPTNELIKSLGAWIQVPLEAHSPHDPTYAYIYTKNISYKKIKDFVWSLGLP